MKKTYLRDGRAPIPKSEITSRVMSSIHARNTKPELTLRRALRAGGLSGYRLHWKKAPGRPDIAYPKKRIAIFVNGCFWHRCPICKPKLPRSNIEFWREKFKKNKARDKRKERELKKLGWQVLVIWECQLKEDPVPFVKEIKELLDQ
jgi:DNA mismatch endonuclease (patch repair protein)